MGIRLQATPHLESLAKVSLLVALTVMGTTLLAGQVSGISPSNAFVAFLVTSKTSSTLLSPSNTGIGRGVVLPSSVVNGSNITPSNFASLFIKSPLSFQGRGFNTTFPSSGFFLLTVEVEGPAGLTPGICNKIGLQRNSNGGNPGPGFFGCNPVPTPLAGPGTTVNETLYLAFTNSPSQNIVPNNNVYFSMFFYSTNSTFIGSTILLHYSGVTSNSTSYFRIST